jgi:hypothetical protein
MRHGELLLSVIARSEATKQSSLFLLPLDCFAEACHRAALHADPLARNDDLNLSI